LLLDALSYDGELGAMAIDETAFSDLQPVRHHRRMPSYWRCASSDDGEFFRPKSFSPSLVECHTAVMAMSDIGD
jgi:hypothetical protein